MRSGRSRGQAISEHGVGNRSEKAVAGRTLRLVLLFLLMGCSGGSSDQASSLYSEGKVPIAGNLVPDGTLPLVTIGVIDGDDEQTMGEITDMVITPDGGVIILDRLGPDLRWFGPDGRFRGRTGNRGRGPGEFLEAFDLLIGQEGEILVVDGPLRKTAVFATGPEGLTLVEARPLGRWGNQLCVLDSGLLVWNIKLEDDAFLHRMNPNGETMLSFGELVRETPPEVVAATGRDASTVQNHGHLWCDPTEDMYYVLHSAIPWLRAFDRSGTEVWRTVLSGLHGVHQWVLEGGRVRTGPHPDLGYSDGGYELFQWGADTLAVSIGRFDARTYSFSYEVRLVRASTGEELERWRAPMIVSGMDDTRVYGYVNHPFPQIFIYSR